MGPTTLIAAWALDALAGDPPGLARFHPIVMIGRLIGFLERRLYREGAPPDPLIRGGGLLWLSTIGITFITAIALPAGAALIHPALGWAVAVVLGWSCLATRDLDRQVRNVANLVDKGRLDEARRALAMIVGRDTGELDEADILRAAFETAAENSSDGVVAPMLYLGLGAALGLGPALGLTYKAVNTLDSMVGYRNERYEYFGRIPAGLDDLFNYLPARFTALLAALCAQLLFATGARTLKTVGRDAGKHSSPNAGYPESAFAAALGVQLGGDNYYGGVKRSAPLIGEPVNPMSPAAIFGALKLLWALSLVTLATILLVWTVAITF